MLNIQNEPLFHPYDFWILQSRKVFKTVITVIKKIRQHTINKSKNLNLYLSVLERIYCIFILLYNLFFFIQCDKTNPGIQIIIKNIIVYNKL